MLIKEINNAPSALSSYTQLFRESFKRLSRKAYATVPKGFMGNSCLQLSDRISRCLRSQEGESMNIGTHAISL